MKQYLFTIILTATIAFTLSWAISQISRRYKLYPGIRERDVHTTPTPRLGGVAIFIAIAATTLLSAVNPFFGIMWVPPQTMWAILSAALLINVLGVLDDVYDLDWMIKLGVQFIAAGIITIVGGLQILSLPFGDIIVVSSWVSIVITMLAIVIVMNAVNFIDGLDGLVAGVCLIANSVFFCYSYMLTRDLGASSYFNISTFLAAVMIGACIGFLPLNWSPAKLFMGDSGALLLGLLMATSAIALTGSLAPSTIDPEQLGRSQLLGAFIPIVLPLVVVMLPLLDFGMAVLRRMRAGKSPFSPDRAHLHHRMLDLGHRHRDAVLIFYAWTGIISFAVLLMYIGARQDWIGHYLPGVLFGLIGSVACLVVTLLPSPKPDPAQRDAAKPRPVPAHPKEHQ